MSDSTAQNPLPEAVTGGADGHVVGGQKSPATPSLLVWLALLLALLALGVGGLLWRKLDHAQQELARRSTDTGALVAETRSVAAQAEALTQELQARLSVAEVRLSEVSLQRSQLEELMISVSRSRDDSLVQDIESALRLAQQQTQLTGSAQPLISSLQAAEQRIARAAQPRLNPVQRAIARDIDRIKSMVLLDVPALATRLQEAMGLIDGLQLANEKRALSASSEGARAPQASEVKPRKPAAPEAKAMAGKPEPVAQGGVPQLAEPETGNTSALPQTWKTIGLWWDRWMAQIWEGVRERGGQLVRVSRIDKPEAALLAPEQAFFLRENLKLKLLNARLGLMGRQMDAARADVLAAQDLLERYFNPQENATRTMLQALKQLAKDIRQVELPRPDDTLTALAVAADGR